MVVVQMVCMVVLLVEGMVLQVDVLLAPGFVILKLQFQVVVQGVEGEVVKQVEWVLAVKVVGVVMAKVLGGLKLQEELVEIDVVLDEGKNLLGEGKRLMGSVEGGQSTVHILEGGSLHV
jgi:hypothetical protein